MLYGDLRDLGKPVPMFARVLMDASLMAGTNLSRALTLLQLQRSAQIVIIAAPDYAKETVTVQSCHASPREKLRLAQPSVLGINQSRRAARWRRRIAAGATGSDAPPDASRR